MRTAICKVEMLTEKYILLDSLLFKIVTTPEKETALLAIVKVQNVGSLATQVLPL